MSEVTTNTESLIRHIEERANVKTLNVDRGTQDTVPVLAVPRGVELRSAKAYLDEMRLVPERRKGTAQLARLADFIAHVNRFKCVDTVVFIDPVRPSALAVYDYHPAGSDVFVANNCGHGAAHTFPVSRALKAWREIDRKPLDQRAFAAFISEHSAEILSPSETSASVEELASLDLTVGTPDVMRRLAKGLRVSVAEDFEESRSLENGDVALSFARKTTATRDAKGSEIKVPGGFVVGVSVLDGDGAVCAIPAMLRFDQDGARLTWTVTLMHLDEIMDRVIEGAAARIAEETGCPVLYGSMEK